MTHCLGGYNRHERKFPDGSKILEKTKKQLMLDKIKHKLEYN